MKIAAIDVGTNSIRTIIAQVHGDGTFELVDQLKDMVRLGEGESAETGLTERAIRDGLAALVKARTIADAHQVDRVIAVATSAVREAKNGGSFIDLVQRETGIDINVITGEEEARLIYLGARETVRLASHRALFIDVGGGSVEFIVGDRNSYEYTASLKIGVLHLLNRFPISDPVKSKEVQAAEAYVTRALRGPASDISRLGYHTVVTTSGTNLTLLALAFEQGRKDDTGPGSLNNQAIAASRIQSVCKWMLKSSTAERRRAGHIQPGRLDSIVMGAVLWQCLIPQLKIKMVTGSTFTLREGMIIDFVQTHLPSIRQEEKYPDPRRRSALALAQRSNWNEAHGKHVATLALSLFDQLKGVLRLPLESREWLEYASLLHDIGYHISAKAHHRHGAYLVLNGELLGFSQTEIRILAAVVRYHRKKKPEKGDPELDGLTPEQRRTVTVLAGILRIADGLDRTHFQLAERLTVARSGDVVEIRVLSRGDAELEIWFARQRAGLLGENLGRKIEIRLAETFPGAIETPVSPDPGRAMPASEFENQPNQNE